MGRGLHSDFGRKFDAQRLLAEEVKVEAKNPYREGYKAANDAYSGKASIKDNPYPDGSPEGKEWMKGYLDAGTDWDNLSRRD